MGKEIMKIAGVTAASVAVLASSFGCAGPARNQPYRAPERGPGVTERPGGTQAGIGTPGGLTGASWDNRTVRGDWGQQISDVVAGMDGLRSGTAAGPGPAGTAGGPATAGIDNRGRAGAVGHAPVGVSTLLVGNVAFVGIDAATIGGTTATGTPGATAGVGPTAGSGGVVAGPSAPGIAASPMGTDITGVSSGGTSGASSGVFGRGNGGIRAAHDEPPAGPITLAQTTNAPGAGFTRSAPGIAASPMATDTPGVTVAGTGGASSNVFGRGNGGIRGAHDMPPGGPIQMGGTPAAVGAPAVGGAAASGLDAAIRDRVLRAFPQVKEVFVTTDPALVSRIARVTGSIQTGTSISGQLSEVIAIVNAMAGTTTGTTGVGGTTGTTTGTTGATMGGARR